jgi:hypothetical protein
MSAIAVKVSSDKQTLILAGESLPTPRAPVAGGRAAGRGLQLQRVTMLLLQSDYASNLAPESGAPRLLTAAAAERSLLPPAESLQAAAGASRSLVPYSPKRALSAGAAEYARTQNLSSDGVRSQLIDTYA